MKFFGYLVITTLSLSVIQEAKAATCPQKLSEVAKCIDNKCEVKGWTASPILRQHLDQYSLKKENTQTFGTPTCQYALPSGQTVILMKK